MPLLETRERPREEIWSYLDNLMMDKQTDRKTDKQTDLQSYSLSRYRDWKEQKILIIPIF